MALLLGGARQFAEAFPEHSIIISQDDKAKIPLGIPAVGCTFSTLSLNTKSGIYS